MNKEKRVRREIIFSEIFILIGILALLAGFVFNFQKNIMIGLAAGFTPTGIGMLAIYIYATKHPKLMKNMELENEERNMFINTKAGHTSFWISYWYVFVAAIFGNLLNLSFQSLCIFTLFFMPFIYFIFIFIYHKRY